MDRVVRMPVLNVGPRDTFVQRQCAGFGWWHWRPASGASNFFRLVAPLWAVVRATAALPMSRAGVSGFFSMKPRSPEAPMTNEGVAPACHAKSL